MIALLTTLVAFAADPPEVGRTPPCDSYLRARSAGLSVEALTRAFGGLSTDDQRCVEQFDADAVGHGAPVPLAQTVVVEPAHQREPAWPRLPPDESDEPNCEDDSAKSRTRSERAAESLGSNEECGAALDLIDAGAPGCEALAEWYPRRASNCPLRVQVKLGLFLLRHGDDEAFAAASLLAYERDTAVAEDVAPAMLARMPQLPAAMISALLGSPSEDVRRLTIRMLVGREGVFSLVFVKPPLSVESSFAGGRVTTVDGGKSIPPQHLAALERVLLHGDEVGRRDAAASIAYLWKDDGCGPESLLALANAALAQPTLDAYIEKKMRFVRGRVQACGQSGVPLDDLPESGGVDE